MNSRERILAAVTHQQPDKVPVDFGSHRSSGIMAIAYKNLREYLDLPSHPIRVYDFIQQLAIIDDDVLERFDADAIELGRGFANEESDWKSWQLPDGTDCLIPVWVDVRKNGDDWYLYSSSGKPVGIQKKGMLYFDQIHWPFLNGIPEDLSDLSAKIDEDMWAIPTPPGPVAADLEAFIEGAKMLRKSTDKAIIGLFGGGLVELTQQLCRPDNLFISLATEPDRIHQLLERITALHLASLENYLNAVGSYIDIVLFGGDDLGMQTGPQFSPEMYRQFYKPYHSLIWKRAKKLTDAKVMLHCCGAIRPLLDDLIDAGIDAINPVQTSCSGMEPNQLKNDFGDRLCFWGGGCDTQVILSSAAPEDVRRHVLEQLQIFSPGGGFVFQQVHNIMANVPPENIVAMFDAVAEFNQ